VETGGLLEPPPEEPLLPVCTGRPLPDTDELDPLEPVEMGAELSELAEAPFGVPEALTLGRFAWTVRRTTLVPSARVPVAVGVVLVALIA
jgi:hypothetical protein